MVETLFIVTDDPRRSHRPAEAIRIAAGVGAWKKVATHLYFRGAAILCLSEFPDDLVLGSNIERYLPTAAEGANVLVQEGTELALVIRSSVKFVPINDARLASIAARMKYVLHF